MQQKKSVSSEDNKSLVSLFTKNLSHVEHFIFFGTLLGFIREGEPISGDDDVDVFVNKIHFDEIKKVIQKLDFVIDESNFPNTTKFFIQAKGQIKENDVTIDFYFYDSDADEDYIIEYWTGHSAPEKEDSILKIPKALIFPLNKRKFNGLELDVPHHSEVVCEYLYGISWRVPARYLIDYATFCHGGRLINYKFMKVKNLFSTKKIFKKVVKKLLW